MTNQKESTAKNYLTVAKCGGYYDADGTGIVRIGRLIAKVSPDGTVRFERAPLVRAPRPVAAV